MGGENCSYKGCKNDSRFSDREYMEGIFFLKFPNQKTDLSKCNRWISACARPEFITLKNLIKRRICSFHFIGGAGPTEKFPDPIAYHDYCVDDTHETCLLKITETQKYHNTNWHTEESNHNFEELFLPIKEPSLNPDELSFSAEDSNLKPDELSLSVEEISFNIKIEPSFNTNEKPSFNASENSSAVFNNLILRKQVQSSVVTDTTDLLKKFIENQYFSHIKELRWTISLNDDSSLSIFKTNTPHICAIEVKIRISLEFEILIYGNSLDKDNSLLPLGNFPEKISKLSDLLNILDYINKLTLCNGCHLENQDIKYSGKLGNVNIYTKTLYSKNCQVFVKNRTSCRNCKSHTNYLLRKQKIESKKGPRSYRLMSRESLVAALKVKTRQNRTQNQQIQQLKKTIKTLKQFIKEEPNLLF